MAHFWKHFELLDGEATWLNAAISKSHPVTLSPWATIISGVLSRILDDLLLIGQDALLVQEASNRRYAGTFGGTL